MLRSAGVLTCLLLVSVDRLAAGTLAVQIVDETGSSCPARVYLTDETNDVKFPSSAIIYNESLGALSERYFIPPTGTFRIDLPAGRYRLRIRRKIECNCHPEPLFNRGAGYGIPASVSLKIVLPRRTSAAAGATRKPNCRGQ